MGKILGYLSGAGAGVLVVFAMASSATAIPETRTPSVGWLVELDGKVIAPKPPAVATPEQPAKPEPTKPEVKPTEPVKVATPEPKKPDPVKPPEPAKPEPVKVVTPDPVKPPEPAKPEPVKPEPVKVVTPEPKKPEPLVAKPPPPAPKPVAVAPTPKPAAPPEPAEPEGVGTLNVTSEPPGAAVFLDGANVGQTPIEIDVPSGAHKIRAVHPTDGTDKKQNVTVKANGTATVQIAF